jgi:hypothetical protein
MKYSYNIIIFIIIICVGIIIFNSLTKNSQKLGFQNYNTRWSPDLIKRFNIFQTTMNKGVNQFNLDQLQRQASPSEAEEYLRNGMWSWPDDLKNLYIEKVWSNPIIKIDPQYALNYAMRLYNQNAVRELLAWNTKEGHFLLYGGDIGVSDGMPKNMNNTIKCSTDSIDNSVMQKKVYTGMNLWNGFMNSITTDVKPEDIPKEMPGFSFVKSPCNPCVAFNSPGDFSCPFKLNVKAKLPSDKGDDSISEPWKQLWNL